MEEVVEMDEKKELLYLAESSFCKDWSNEDEDCRWNGLLNKREEFKSNTH
jgi:hypothetical protein